jgi:hypothetical protein
MKSKSRILKSSRFAIRSVLTVSIMFTAFYACLLFPTSFDIRPTSCFFGIPFLTQQIMQSFIIAIGWDAQFTIGKIQISSRFTQDAYGCGKPREDGRTDIGLIVLGPSLRMTHFEK